MKSTTRERRDRRAASVRAAWSPPRAWSRLLPCGGAGAAPRGRAGPGPLRRAVRARAAARRSSPARPRPSWRSCSARASMSTTSRAAPATSRWARSPRADDQHTLILGHIGTLAVNPFIFDKLPYDAIKDFQPISLLAKVPSLYVVHPDLPAKNLKEFVALRQVEAGPAELRLGRQRQRRPPRVRVPEDGDRHLHAARAVPRHRAAADRPAGRAGSTPRRSARRRSCSSSRPASCAASRPASTQRIAQLPDVPTVAEQGFPGFEMTQWYGLLRAAPTWRSRRPTSSRAAAAKAMQRAGCAASG